MPADATTITTLVRFLVRQVRSGKKPRDYLEQLSLEAFAKQQDGVTFISHSFEGGSSSAQVNCSPGDLMAAAEQALIETDPENPGAHNGGHIIHEDLSRTLIET